MARDALTPTQVIDTAAAIADSEGLEAVSLARIAADLGVRPPSLYRHVANLEAVQVALSIRGLREAQTRLQRAAVGRAREDAILALGYAYWQFSRDCPGLYAASLRAFRPGEREIATAASAILDTALGVLAGYGLKGDEALHAARGLRSIIHGFVSLDFAGGFRLQLDPNESLRRMLRAFARELERGDS